METQTGNPETGRIMFEEIDPAKARRKELNAQLDLLYAAVPLDMKVIEPIIQEYVDLPFPVWISHMV